ncbi:MAG: division/cell wall cluster transcriptional repressor MraZ [Actinobacteria bacterium]|nr:division/cell wall cluster transcriptional repressor MraZ [Actinomycetota bacterium]
MFIGTYEHTIDDKSRLTLPVRFRAELGTAVVLSRGLDGVVAVYPRGAWTDGVQTRIAALDPLSRRARELQRFFFAGASEATVDSQGRILVPGALTAYASLEREVVVTGMNDHLELWNPTSWSEHMEAVEGGSAEDAAEHLADLGL